MGARSRFRRGLTADERALLAALVIEMGPRLLAYVHRAYGSNDAEDVVAETFCRAAGNIAALRDSNRRDLYLLTVARNLCRDRFRRRRSNAESGDALGQRPADTGRPDDRILGDEQLRRLRQAVAALPNGLREVVVLRLSAGLKFEQIAELLHVPLGTALSRMHAAVRHLRGTLGCVHEL
jgi:RNA polymerase sigma-70 factor (ECF subfamily)